LFLTAPAPVIPLTVAVVEPAFRALLVASVGAPPLLPASVGAALSAAIAMSAIAVGADEKHGVALLTETDSLKKNRFAVSLRHASSQAGPRQRHTFRGRLEPALFGLATKAAELEALPLPTAGLLRFTPLLTQ
jgi:hypothetical protein